MYKLAKFLLWLLHCRHLNTNRVSSSQKIFILLVLKKLFLKLVFAVSCFKILLRPTACRPLRFSVSYFQYILLLKFEYIFTGLSATQIKAPLLSSTASDYCIFKMFRQLYLLWHVQWSLSYSLLEILILALFHCH